MEIAKKAAAAAIAVAKEKNWSMAVAVTDGSGSLVYFERMDNTQYGSVDLAIGKAKSATAFRRSTKDFEGLLAQGGAGNPILIVPYAMPVEGGVPIIIGGHVVGVIGTSGGSSHRDGELAVSGANAVK